jgi:hypothetical protein
MSFTLNLDGFLPPSPASTLSAPRLLSDAGQPRLGFLLPMQLTNMMEKTSNDIFRSGFIQIFLWLTNSVVFKFCKDM